MEIISTDVRSESAISLCFQNLQCSHWDKCKNTYDNVTHAPFTNGPFIDHTVNILEVLGSISIVCSAINIVTYFLWRPLQCYSRQLVVIYAIVSLFLSSVIIHIVRGANFVEDLEKCEPDREKCLLLGALINFGYTSLFGWTVVIFYQIFQMASTSTCDDPSFKQQIIIHVVVWGTAAIQSIVPYFFGIVGYLGRPTNDCGYCFWDQSSIEYYGSSFESDHDCNENRRDYLAPPRLWLWFSGASYALFCGISIVIIFIMTKITISKRIRDNTLVHSQRADLALIEQIQRQKLLVTVAMHSVVVLSVLVRTIWMSAPTLLYDEENPKCKLSSTDVDCFPTNSTATIPSNEIQVIYNRDITIFMFFECVMSTLAGIVNFLLFCAFSKAFKLCGKVWVKNLFTRGSLFLSVQSDKSDVYYYGTGYEGDLIGAMFDPLTDNDYETCSEVSHPISHNR